MSEDPSLPNGSRGAGAVIERLRKLLRIGRFAARNDLGEALAEAADPTESLSPLERAMLRNVLTLRQVTVGDVMVPRADIFAVEHGVGLGELLRVFRNAGHSRLPVYEETLDDPRGMIHIRDFLVHIAERAEAQTEGQPERAGAGALGAVDLSVALSSVNLLRPVLFAPASMPVVDLLLKMQSTRTHMALVIDEYGGTEGLASIEDLVEVIVGDIEDEHDESDAPMIREEREGVFIANGRIPLEDASTAFGVDLGGGEAAEDVDTLAGLIVTLAGRVPVRGEIVKGPSGIEFEIMDADPKRVKRVRLMRAAAERPRRRPRAASEEQPTESVVGSGPKPGESG